MLTELEHGYSMLACATPQRPPLSADFDRISSVFFFLFLLALFFTLYSRSPPTNRFHLRVRGRLGGRASYQQL